VQEEIMTDLFLIICAVSVVFFLIFLVQCSRPTRKSTTLHQKSNANSAVRKVAEPQPIYAVGGRRFFVHLEEQMSEFLSAHGRTAAMLLVMFTLPLMLRAQSLSGPSPEQP
jgi:hypothetical protein